ncbi:DUF983 domain-containing protein [Croceicoccus naphthovorans]|uniref:Uncharacterized protein n=1 Tax=Croceicoccus naphthovorans TaxID=1348774 RepID=A0A0G3XHB7_9SPHN|nr:DUF983 domain-containing protein [Croceicoccus naphthovorans]AKM10552.1 hypothetical protein AB433_12195 [Croceicoccus naphthovorans]MBB3988752.1 uncharacterized protein (DUF983 family) [Croceicoccus naphthovorans]
MSDTPEREGGGLPEVPAAASVMKAAALGKCPRCGSRTMFAGLVNFADKCGQCGLNYARFNVGDGPAAFLTLAIGAVLALFAILFDQAVHPPFWVHALIWVPLTAAMVVYGLRIAKGALLIVEYRRDAYEAGSLETDGTRRDDPRADQ